MAKRLKWKEYDYTVQLGPGNSWVYRPVIEVDIQSGQRRVPVLAMLDSGTDGTVLDASVAERLGIDYRQCQKVKLGGIGSVEGFLSTIELTVSDMKVKMDIPVVFAKDLPMEGLLGQRHFFQRFKVRFEKDINKFYLAAV
jgi:hypothetical protein